MVTPRRRAPRLTKSWNVTKQLFKDYGNLAPIGNRRLGRLLCRLRKYHQIESTTTHYDMCVTCRSRWFRR